MSSLERAAEMLTAYAELVKATGKYSEMHYIPEIEFVIADLRAARSTPKHGEAAGWQPIETAPKDDRRMFVVQGFNVPPTPQSIAGYTTDPYCVWRADDGSFARWPHQFPPTHWMPLPAAPKEPKP